MKSVVMKRRNGAVARSENAVVDVMRQSLTS
jgi:hypothetical protein